MKFLNLKRKAGASGVAYGLVVGLIAVAIIASVDGLGTNIAALFSQVGGHLNSVNVGEESEGSTVALPALPELPPQGNDCGNGGLTTADVSALAAWSGDTRTAEQWCGLTSFSLANNRGGTMPPEFGKLTQLTTVSLTRNSLGELPAEIGHLVNLESLSIGYGNTSLPPEIGYLTNLTRIYAGYVSGVTSFPEELGYLTNLDELAFGYGSYTSLPNSIGNMTNLRSIQGPNSKIVELPDGLKNLAGLQSVDLRNNDLSIMHESFATLTGITTLHLIGNEFVNLSDTLCAYIESRSSYNINAEACPADE